MKKPTKPSSRLRKRCQDCGEVKSWVEFSSNDRSCVTCKQIMYGQGLHALQTTLSHEEKR